MKKTILFDYFNLFGHIKSPTTGIIIHGSPPCIIDMLVQYYTHLAWPINLHKFMQYTGKLLKNKESLYYLAFHLLWVGLYNTIHTLPSA